MEYIELDFLGSAKEIDPHFIELFERITGHNINIKKKNQDKKSYLITIKKNIKIWEYFIEKIFIKCINNIKISI